jgi:hypothetical protein
LASLGIIAGFLLSGCGKRNPPGKDTSAGEQASLIEDLEPVPFSQKDSKTSFTSEQDRLEVVYLDLGDDAGFIIRSPSNVMILADVNGDGLPTPRIDRIYGVDLDERRMCVFNLESDAGGCRSDHAIASSARIAGKPSTNENDRYEIAIRIPKVELLGENRGGLIVFETFDTGTASRMKRFPGARAADARINPFQRAFRLRKGLPEEVPRSWPGLSGPPPPGPAQPKQYELWSHLRFRAEPDSIFFGEKPALTWVSPPDTEAVDLQPGFGNVQSPQGVSPEHTQVYTLRLKRRNGEWEQESVTVRVRDVQIDAFRIQPVKVRYGQTFTITWDVRGAKDIKITAAGSPQGASMNLLRSGNVRNQSKLTLTATQADFPSGGTYEFKLTAEGPGGPKIATAVLQVVQ